MELSRVRGRDRESCHDVVGEVVQMDEGGMDQMIVLLHSSRDLIK